MRKLVAVLGILAVGVMPATIVTHAEAETPVPAAVVPHEGDLGWFCGISGNHVCGPVAR